jgi:hypothetical protein
MHSLYFATKYFTQNKYYFNRTTSKYATNFDYALSHEIYHSLGVELHDEDYGCPGVNLMSFTSFGTVVEKIHGKFI